MKFEDIIPQNVEVLTGILPQRDFFSFQGLIFCDTGHIFRNDEEKLIFVDYTFERQHDIIKALNGYMDYEVRDEIEYWDTL